eukprot:TRINITY_DN13462_c0_g1_i1.p1 TRINITY_DN13462_c0_g1~~TRINITY_DN13462_c0_g1_i1.p1  ORF type:complete len:233 (-),score=51.86 TRINITY_DN13462_c0_g1_i1:421-1119(-)
MSLEQYDSDQVKMMEEECILVDLQDTPLGPISKKTSHLVENIEKGMLHRAFSVFLFNSKNELLLQQRAHCKITFPLMWTNTCCSHPLHFAAELEVAEQIGVKRAAQRKLQQELGIPPEQVPLEAFTFLTRMHYMALSDPVWGEHEIDYILFIKRDVDVSPNANEVESVRWVNQEQLKELVSTAEERGVKVTPWFALIGENFLYKWWNDVDTVAKHRDVETIHRLGKDVQRFL